MLNRIGELSLYGSLAEGEATRVPSHGLSLPRNLTQHSYAIWSHPLAKSIVTGLTSSHFDELFYHRWNTISEGALGDSGIVYWLCTAGYDQKSR